MTRAIITLSAVAAALLLAQAMGAAAGEFDDSCAMGLASGQTLKTDCSVSWTSPEDGKIYCFSSDSSKQAFLKNTEGNLKRAQDFVAMKVAAVSHGPKEFTDTDVEARVNEVLAERSKDGTFVFYDARLNTDLNLIFEEIEIVRGMRGYGWFANVIFHDKDEPKKQYALDFWFKPEGADLRLMDIRVRKGPKRGDDGYYMKTRLPVAWWWIPASEHPGTTEDTRAWHVMSAVHTYIAENRKDGAIGVKDDKTGETIDLEFIEIHMPVRRLKKDGQFFVCTDFRKKGSENEFYDIDFWVDESTGKLKVKDIKMHKVPVEEDGIWSQEKRYDFKNLEYEKTR